MKVLATSDLHGNLDSLRDYLNDIDIVCIAGDIGPLNGFSIYHVYKQKQWIEKQLTNLGNEYPNIQFVCTPGNHDLFATAKERFSSIKQHDIKNLSWKVKLPKNVHMLIDSKVNINGLNIYGAPWVPIINYVWAFEGDYYSLQNKYRKIPKNIDILISHSPPYISEKCEIDKSLEIADSMNFGSKALAEAILEKKPKYLFCGHIHSGDHNLVNFGQTCCYNVSRLNEQYNIAYEPLILEI